MKPVYSMVALTLAGIAVLYGAVVAQSERAFENVSVLRAQKIELADAGGVTRARFTTEENGEVVLRLMAANGELRVKLGAGNDGSGLQERASACWDPEVCSGHYFPSGIVMTEALAQRLVRFLEASAPADRERRQQLSDLYLVHWKGLCGYVRAQFGPGPPEPEDIAQSAFIRFAAADAAHIENPRAFLYATARNLVIDHHRHAQRVCAHEQATAEDRVYELSPENVLLQAERFRILAQALQRMPLKRRRLVLLNRFEGLSYAEIGEQFGMSAENVRKHIERTLAECLRALRG